ncbi:MAG: peptidase M23 [Legionellales bacterium]|nr:peptidase M23 [Legionellales bacterium]|tara:strand:- start:284 stop:1099 length:816 start_codon:yes stop_codon:yes gene_type:complete
MLFQYKNSFFLLFFIILLQSCSGSGVAPVTQRQEVKESSPTVTKTTKKVKKKSTNQRTKKTPDCYLVTKGDTLYSIAWRYNYDYKRLADWNGIESPYVIYLGDKICFKSVFKKKKVKSEPKSNRKKPVANDGSSIKQNIAKKKDKNLSSKVVDWFWPTKGKILKLNSPTSKKGVDILGSSGQAVKAAAKGEIVYSGSGLVGYGKLIIIKHSEKFLSAYAYNESLLVKEGDIIKAGEKISEMGQDPTGRNILHFEIRLNGKPVNPLNYLPKK